MVLPMMPKATAAWLVDNTALTFDQIAQFCGLHELEVQAIADGEIQNVRPLNPVLSHQLTKEEIARCEKNPKLFLKITQSAEEIRKTKRRENYIPLSQRQNRPNAILWVVKNHPEVSDSQICKLLHTTKNTIEAIRTGNHRMSASLRPQNPITLGLCAEIDFYAAIEKGRKKLAKQGQTPEDIAIDTTPAE